MTLASWAGRAQELLDRVDPRYTRCRLDVPIDRCVHYAGFRYGGEDYNVYETYLRDLQSGPVRDARRRLVDFLRHYRPRHMAEALGIGSLERAYPIWEYPWRYPRGSRGWRDAPNDCPDIVTHFAEEGVLTHRIDEEFFWLERALERMRREGYRTERACVSALRLRFDGGGVSYLLLDGNHRVAALSSLGHRTVRVRLRAGADVIAGAAADWPGVRSGRFTRADAVAIMDAYRNGNRRPRTHEEPARFLGPAGWSELYA